MEYFKPQLSAKEMIKLGMGRFPNNVKKGILLAGAKTINEV